MEGHDHLLLVFDQERAILTHIVESDIVVDDEVAHPGNVVETARFAATQCFRAHLNAQISDQKQCLFNDF